MYEYIRGELREILEQAVVVEAGGIGYRITATGSTIAALSEVGTPVVLFIHLVHREDVMELFGFSDRVEREVFRKLLSISGIGARQAHKILSGMAFSQFVTAVLADDITGLTSIPGLGKKRAEKIAFELKDKVASLSVGDGGSPAQVAVPEEAILALEALGFSGMMAKSAVRRGLEEVEDADDIQAVIRAALRHV